MLQPIDLLKGDRIRLRRSTSDDATAIILAVSDEEVMRFIDWPIPTEVSQTREYLEGCAIRWKPGEEYQWAVDVKDTIKLIVAMSCRIDGHQANFGYFSARQARGQGYATEAGALLVDWLRDQPEIFRIWATTDYENHPSARVLEKLRLQLKEVRRSATFRPNIGGLPRDTLISLNRRR